MWLFEDNYEGQSFLFSSEEKFNEFIKAYSLKTFDISGSFPEEGEDYRTKCVNVDCDLTENLAKIFWYLD